MRTCLVASIVVLVASCKSERGAPAAFPTADHAGESVHVTVGGNEIEAVVAPSPNHGYALRDPQNYEIPIEAIDEVSVSNHLLGFAQGLGIGILSGAAGGAMLGYASGDDPPCDDFCLFNSTAEEKAALGAFALGFVGGVFGGILGAIYGQHDVWRAERSTAPKPMQLTPSGPPGSVVGLGFAF